MAEQNNIFFKTLQRLLLSAYSILPKPKNENSHKARVVLGCIGTTWCYPHDPKCTCNIWRVILFSCVSFRVVDVGSEWRTFSNEKSTSDPSRVGAAQVRQADCVTHEKSLLSRLKSCLILFREVVMWGTLDYHESINLEQFYWLLYGLGQNRYHAITPYCLDIYPLIQFGKNQSLESSNLPLFYLEEKWSCFVKSS